MEKRNFDEVMAFQSRRIQDLINALFCVFDEVVETIKDAEKGVDKVLDAARLERHEGPSTKLSADQKMLLLCILLGIVAMTVFFGFLSLDTIIRRW